MDEVERKSVMLDILYEDKDILVVVKPAGVESQTSRRLEPDMVSEIKNYLHRKVQETKKLSTGLSPKASTAPVDPYVGIIHRLDTFPYITLKNSGKESCTYPRIPNGTTLIIFCSNRREETPARISRIVSILVQKISHVF